MANVNDYIDWRGDITFENAPFCDPDNLILAELCFLDFEGIVPSDYMEGSVRLEDAVNKYFETTVDEARSLGYIIPDDIKVMAKKMAVAERFKDLRLTAFVNITDTEKQLQFCALTTLLPDGSAYVSFRGTDDTIVGWRENFNMMFTFPVPAQTCSLDYVTRLLDVFDGNIRIGGHSKGGNLSLYAAASCAPEYQNRIIRVYNNDGPGFGHGMLSSKGYLAIRDRITMIIPQASVVGMLFEHESTYFIVKSTYNGILQHNGYSWEVFGNKFVPFDSLTKDSIIIDKSIRSIVSQMDEEESRRFVNAMFEVLGASNAQTLTDIMKNKNAFIKALRSVPAESRDIVMRTIMKIIGESGHVWISTVKSKSDTEKKKSDREKVKKRAALSAQKEQRRLVEVKEVKEAKEQKRIGETKEGKEVKERTQPILTPLKAIFEPKKKSTEDQNNPVQLPATAKKTNKTQ